MEVIPWDKRVESVRSRLAEMAARASSMVGLGVRCLAQRDEAAGQAVLRADREVDRLEMDIDRVALGSLESGGLTERPLRFVVSAFKITTDLERIGDESVKLAHAGLTLMHHHLMPERRTLEALGRPVQTMLDDAIRAFEEGRPDLARAVIDRDDDIDRAYRDFAVDLRGRMSADLAAIERLVQVRFAAKCLERIADHATNLAEQAIFVVSGDDVRHRQSPR